jgi:hypothetical protein
MSDDAEAGALSVDELVEYCRTQAGLLSGRVQTIGEEADGLLDEIDEDIAGIRTRLTDRGGPSAGSSSPAGTTVGDGESVAEIEDLEAELEAKQALVEAKQARMAEFQDLAAGYVELAEELDADPTDWRAALDRVVAFERDNDAPVYFEDRQTIYEAAAADDAPGE